MSRRTIGERAFLCSLGGIVVTGAALFVGCLGAVGIAGTYRYIVERPLEEVRCVEFDRPAILADRECVRWQRFTTAAKP
ncbi:hypothetical protein DBA29_17110 [Xenophilus aerolatus]|nr:hypothetical protein [Xenophilus aerolatus]